MLSKIVECFATAYCKRKYDTKNNCNYNCISIDMNSHSDDDKNNKNNEIETDFWVLYKQVLHSFVLYSCFHLIHTTRSICIILSMQFSSWFDFMPVKNDAKRSFSLAMGYFVRIFIFILFLPNVSITFNPFEDFKNLWIQNSKSFKVVTFYQSAVLDFDMDIALESLLFVSTHFIINTQLYCAIWNTSILQQLSALLSNEISQSMSINCTDESKKQTFDFKYAQEITPNLENITSKWNNFTLYCENGFLSFYLYQQWR